MPYHQNDCVVVIREIAGRHPIVAVFRGDDSRQSIESFMRSEGCALLTGDNGRVLKNPTISWMPSNASDPYLVFHAYTESGRMISITCSVDVVPCFEPW